MTPDSLLKSFAPLLMEKDLKGPVLDLACGKGQRVEGDLLGGRSGNRPKPSERGVLPGHSGLPLSPSSFDTPYQKNDKKWRNPYL